MFFRIQYRWIVAIVFTFGLFMDIMDSTVVNVALPRFSADFHASTSAVEWTVTGYLLSLAVFVTGAGFLSDRFGTKRLFLTAMAIFVVCSVLCGMAQSLSQLVLFRFLQGVGGGMMTPVGTAIVSRAFPGEERAKAAAVISFPSVLAPLTGPVLGGYLVQYAGWRWIFFINVPIGLTGLLLGIRGLREHKESYAQGKFDVFGLIAGSAGAAMVLYALAEAGPHGWSSATVAGWGLAGITMIAIFVLIEFRVPTPVLDLRLFKQPLFTLGNLVSHGSYADYISFIFLLALFLQELQGRSPFQAGMLQAPAAIGTAFALPLASRIYPRAGPRRMILFGLGATGLAILPFTHLSIGSPWWLLLLLIVIRGIPFSFASVASQTIVYGPLSSAKQGAASSIYNSTRQVVGSFAVALVATILVSRTNAHLPAGAQPGSAAYNHAYMLAFRDSFFVPVALLLSSTAAGFFIKDAVARAAMRRPPTPVAEPPVPQTLPAAGRPVPVE